MTDKCVLTYTLSIPLIVFVFSITTKYVLDLNINYTAYFIDTLLYAYNK